MNKSAFVLMELIIVTMIMSVVYVLFIPKLNMNTKENTKEIKIKDLKKYLLDNFEFEKELKFSCIKKDLSCYVLEDKILKEGFKIDLFKKEPQMYKYKKGFAKYRQSDIKIDGFNEPVVFEYIIDSDFKTNEFILQTDKVYLFNSLFNQPLVFKDIYELEDKLEKDRLGVKYVF